jgi:hypothetical protein
MKTFCLLFLAVLVLGAFTSVHPQRTSAQKNERESLQREQLRKLMSRVGVDVPERDPRNNQPQTYRELKIRWNDATKSTNQPKSALSPAEQTQNSEERTQAPSSSIIEDKRRSGALSRSRSLELSPTQIFIAAVDARNKLRWWSIVPDPRVVRSETQTATGELRAQEHYVSNVTLVVAFPDDPEIANLRFYHPVWNGTEFDLKPLTTVPTR